MKNSQIIEKINETKNPMFASYEIIEQLMELAKSLKEYRGNLWNAQLGLHYQINRRLGVALQGAYFELDGRIRESDWRGQAELKQYGPRASLYVTF